MIIVEGGYNTSLHSEMHEILARDTTLVYTGLHNQLEVAVEPCANMADYSWLEFHAFYCRVGPDTPFPVPFLTWS